MFLIASCDDDDTFSLHTQTNEIMLARLGHYHHHYWSKAPSSSLLSSPWKWKTSPGGISILPSRRRSMATINSSSSSIPHEQRTQAEPREPQIEPVVLSHIRQINDEIRLLRLSAVDPTHTIRVRVFFFSWEKTKRGHLSPQPLHAYTSIHIHTFIHIYIYQYLPTYLLVSNRLTEIHTLIFFHFLLKKFLPGQWVDTFLPTVRQAGGFTITSTPNEARPTSTRSSSSSSHSPPYLELAVQKSKNPPAQWLWRPIEDILDTQLAVRVGGSFTWPPPPGLLDTSAIERLVLIAGGVGIK